MARLGSHAAHGGPGGRSSARIDARRGYGLARTMRTQWEVQLELRNSYYYISAAPQILFIYMAATPCAAGGLIIKVSHRRGQ